MKVANAGSNKLMPYIRITPCQHKQSRNSMRERSVDSSKLSSSSDSFSSSCFMNGEGMRSGTPVCCTLRVDLPCIGRPISCENFLFDWEPAAAAWIAAEVPHQRSLTDDDVTSDVENDGDGGASPRAPNQTEHSRKIWVDRCTADPLDRATDDTDVETTLVKC
ncbi:BQ2448_7828 [Microbotryum intermedium]|uniref:BQ2448_7828 protein n=1 Tax=Microbotryum intermedium TaxID=269621 RepID=A0A238FPV5_9BASI|nr:BQ2448_7828 [Microbotryum intermedium]